MIDNEILILVVDDEEEVEPLYKAMFRKELKAKKYDMHFILSGKEAVDFVDNKIPNSVKLVLLLSDINMPGMSGLELLEEMKKRLPELPVVMITAYDDEEKRNRASDSGAEDFLTKPVNFPSLKQKIDGILIEQGLLEKRVIF